MQSLDAPMLSDLNLSSISFLWRKASRRLRQEFFVEQQTFTFTLIFLLLFNQHSLIWSLALLSELVSLQFIKYHNNHSRLRQQSSLKVHGVCLVMMRILNLWCRSFGNTYGDTKHVPTEKENLEVLEKAVELGVTFVDSADV